MRLALFALALASAAAAPPPTVLRVRNELPSSYRPARMTLLVDGAVRYDGPAFGATYLPRGRHVVELVATYRMHSGWLTYMNGYTVQVRSAHVVTGAPRTLDAFVVRHGGATTPLDRSAAIDWAER